MKSLWMKILCLCLAAVLLLGGCSGSWLTDLNLMLGGYTAFSDMAYTRPDVGRLRQCAQELLEQIPQQKKAAALMEYVYGFFEQYNDFYTNYALADIHYCADLTDLYWDGEYTYCLEATAEVDSLLDQVLYALAASPLKGELESEEYFGPGYFDAYQGESVWTEEFTALMERQSQLVTRYYDLNTQALSVEFYSEEYFTVYGQQMAELFVELVTLRQQIAREAGYADYQSFAYDFYYNRDYTPQQAETLLEEIGTELVPVYRQMGSSDVWEAGRQESMESQTFSYVKNCAKAMGGTVWDAFSLMESARLYDISYSENKYDASFEVFLSNYMEPYVFVNPSLTVYDQLTFAHEFGHFCNDYASFGSMAGIDVAEVFSQGMEYLSLFYGGDTSELRKLKMADCLSIYVEQAGYASFEQQVYGLEAEALTVQNVYDLFEQTGKAFGFDTWNWDSRSFVCVTHFFTNPMYIISYVVSNDAALQLYQAEEAAPGSGLSLLEENLDTQEACFLSFVESAGLKSPFAQGRIGEVRNLLEGILLTAAA